MGPQAYNQFPQNSLRPKTTINKPEIIIAPPRLTPLNEIPLTTMEDLE